MLRERPTRRGASILALSTLLILAGCASAKFIRTGTTYPPNPPDCDIQVYTTKLPDRDYQEIGVIEGKGTVWKSSLSSVLPKLKEQACEAGGDAIIMTSSQRSIHVSGGEDGVTSTEHLDVTATVVRWHRATCSLFRQHVVRYGADNE